MLTAKLPLHIETDSEMTIRCELLLTLIRASNAQKTTRYIVKAEVEDGKLLEEAVEVCSKQLARLQPKSKIVVYRRYKAECEELAEALGCNYFYSGSADNADIIKVWKEAGGCVIATTALGTGVNYAGVALAVHIGMLYGLIDFAQESGRAGRGGEVVTPLILLEKNWQVREGAKRMGNTLTVQPLMSGSAPSITSHTGLRWTYQSVIRREEVGTVLTALIQDGRHELSMHDLNLSNSTR